MKKFVALFLCVVLLVFVVACVDNETTDDPAEKNTDANTEIIATPDNIALETETPVDKSEYKVGETWIVDGQWELTITGITETADRNEFSESNPAAVYIVDFTWKNVGYIDPNGIMDGLFLVLDDSIVDSQGLMGYSYPGEITNYPQETAVGATCNGQVCIGVDNAGLPIKINVVQYDGNGVKQTATFVIE